MALDPVASQRPSSPASSGRASPGLRALPRREDGQRFDKNFRKYASNVERALALFEPAQQEWADYISFLGRLLKTLQSHPPEPRVIPHSALLATRLAQCLIPTLPSGVHQKAVEVYAYIFATLGRDGLAANLHIYFAGLSTVLSFASLTVRPAFLSLVETYLVPLDPQALRPALKAVILSLLPGLEDDTSEDFDRVLTLLDRFRKSANDSYFWQCFFLATVTNASRRQGALAYLARRLPKLSGTPDLKHSERKASIADLSPEAQALVTPEPGLLVRCFSAGLSDPHLLIQRGFLDLLVTHLPLSSPALQYVVQQDDLQRLAMAAAGVVNRRDMSLNRRLWSWFLGPEPKASAEGTTADEPKTPTADAASYHAAYFSRFGAAPLTAGILNLVRAPGKTSTERARPFRICLSLMDRWEVGGLIVPTIFLPALESVYAYSLTASKENIDEVVRSASLFFDGVESGLIWDKMFELSTSALDDKILHETQRSEKLKLYHFIVTRFNVREEEMLHEHVPLALLALLSIARQLRNTSKSHESTRQTLSQLFDIVEALIHLIPSKAFDERSASKRTPNSLDNKSASWESNGSDPLKLVSKFYGQPSVIDNSNLPWRPAQLGFLILQAAAEHFQWALSQRSDVDVCTRVLVDLLHKIPTHETSPEDLRIESTLKKTIENLQGVENAPFSVLSAITTVSAALQLNSSQSAASATSLEATINDLVPLLWSHLSPINVKHHVEAVRCLWTLDAVSGDGRLVESGLTKLLQQQSSADYAQRFAILWSQTVQEKGVFGQRGRANATRRVSSMPGLPSGKTATIDYETILARPLLVILDSLSGDESAVAAFTSDWLMELPTLQYVFAILVSNVARLQCVRANNAAVQSGKNRMELNDIPECFYFLTHIQHILELGTDHIWLTLAGESIPDLQLDNDEQPHVSVIQNVLVDVCMRALESTQGTATDDLQRTALAILQRLLRSPFAAPLKELELAVTLLERLQQSLGNMQPLLQATMLQTILAALQLQAAVPPAPPPLMSPVHLRQTSKDMSMVAHRGSLSGERGAVKNVLKPPPQLLDVLKAGFSTQSTQLALDTWVDFFGQVLPLFTESIFQTMIPFVEIFCKQISSIFDRLKATFDGSGDNRSAPETSLISLMNGLEQLLGHAHQQLIDTEISAARPKSPDVPQGFFANMVPGVFSSDVQQVTRSATANNRLTVLLCFQDAVRLCFGLWTWGARGMSRESDAMSAASFSYTSLRVRNRARRLLEHLFTAEALECLETVGVLWCRPPESTFNRSAVLSLLNVLNGSKPKKTIPAMFNALYSRTNPSALEPKSLSTLTSDLSDIEVAWFLLEYTRSLEDDTMDEIWIDCMAFLKDVLTNPLPHRQALPAMLEFTVVLAGKLENTNFGEERKMRRELSDLFLRLLTAIFTSRSTANVQDVQAKPVKDVDDSAHLQPTRLADTIAMLAAIAPKLTVVIGESDRVWTAAQSISTNILTPALHAKHFPENVSADLSSLVQQLSLIPQASKAWRKDVSDAFNDNRFFNMPRELVDQHWLLIIFQLNVVDKEKMSELLGRLIPPATAGIMFGVGATSARIAADRSAQLNLCRIATLVLACPDDTFASSITAIAEKASQLLIATPLTSPSSATRAELFLLMRALILKVSAIHIAPLWPIINAELTSALLSSLPNAEDAERYDGPSLLQACKLLDVLITISPDEFQLYEWLFISDTVDAVYRPQSWSPAALADDIAEGLGSIGAEEPPLTAVTAAGADAGAYRKLFLDPILATSGLEPRTATREDIIRRVVKPFFGQLSIWAFEATYGMQAADLEACKAGVLDDIFVGHAGLS